jgi:hypothetical protein
MPAPLAPRYVRHVPERTMLYGLVQAYYPDFLKRLEQEDRALPEYVREEFDASQRCGVLDNGFLRVACATGASGVGVPEVPLPQCPERSLVWIKHELNVQSK